MGEATAKMNISDLKKILNINESPDNYSESSSRSTPKSESFNNNQLTHRVRRESMEQLSLIKVKLQFYIFSSISIYLNKSLVHSRW